MKVLIAAPIHNKAIKMLKEAGFEVVVKEYPDESELIELIKDADALIVRSKPLVTRRVIEAAGKLKVIGRAGVGLDNIDLEAADERGITVYNAPDASTNSVAELTIGLMLAVLRKISYADRSMRNGKWVKKECLGRELHGKVLGVIGMGRIGKAVARIAYYGFGMKIIYYSRRRHRDIEEEVKAQYYDLETVLRTADVITIHVSLTPQTKHLINEERLKLMKPTAILINTARGSIIDTNALIKALKEGWIAGAGLDVFEEEPLPKNHPLTELDNVVLTPHIGANTIEAQERAGIEIAHKIIEYFKNIGTY